MMIANSDKDKQTMAECTPGRILLLEEVKTSPDMNDDRSDQAVRIAPY